MPMEFNGTLRNSTKFQWILHNSTQNSMNIPGILGKFRKIFLFFLFFWKLLSESRSQNFPEFHVLQRTIDFCRISTNFAGISRNTYRNPYSSKKFFGTSMKFLRILGIAKEFLEILWNTMNFQWHIQPFMGFPVNTTCYCPVECYIAIIFDLLYNSVMRHER